MTENPLTPLLNKLEESKQKKKPGKLQYLNGFLRAGHKIEITVEEPEEKLNA